ncbi:MAG: acyl-CoA thioesterase-2 [Gammaproteobacteria bacterium]|jgi:acyl-CoA thioesterase-2
MDRSLQRLVDALTLERLEENLFRGAVTDTHVKRVYGGKVLGEAINAAQSTVENDRMIHSVHCTFLREADSNKPVIYEVDRSRDGGSFSARRVVAIQYGRPIFTMEASFHKEEAGLEYQGAMPPAPPPEEVERLSFKDLDLTKAPPNVQRFVNISAPFEIRPIENYTDKLPVGTEPIRRVWIRTVEPLPDDFELHREILAYFSDYGLLSTLLIPHGIRINDRRLRMASLNHAMWFHRPFRIDEWLLYVCEGLSSAHSRGLTSGRFFRRDGSLVVSVAQEALVRLVENDN